MSDNENTKILERIFENALSLGMSEKDAEAYAQQRLAEMPDGVRADTDIPCEANNCGDPADGTGNDGRPYCRDHMDCPECGGMGRRHGTGCVAVE